MQIRLRISTVGKSSACELQKKSRGSREFRRLRPDSRTWVLMEVWVLLQLALTPPASGSMGALLPSPTGSGAVAVERFSYISMFLGSLLCHIIKSRPKQLQKSFNLTAKKVMPTTMAGQKLHKQGELSTAAGGSTPDPLSSRTLLSMHKYYRQKCCLLFWRSGRTPRFLDQFSRFVVLAIVTNTCTTCRHYSLQCTSQHSFSLHRRLGNETVGLV